ncbi:hypothetical protein TSOC_009588, partial [Tetrabaena socialis]
CQPINGYTVALDMDHDGDDIGQAPSVAEATNRCNTDSSCKGINSLGWYKRNLSPLHYQIGLCFYTKVATNCQPISGYTVTIDVDHNGDDIGQSSVADATSRCNADINCFGLNSGGYYKRHPGKDRGPSSK